VQRAGRRPLFSNPASANLKTKIQGVPEMEEVVALLQELLHATQETNRLLDQELNWANDLSLGKMLLARLDSIEEAVREIALT
jgi:hypothetical protein